MADTINKIVGQQAFDEVDKLKDGVEGLYKSFENLTTMIKSVEGSLGSAKGLKEITTVYKRTIDLNKEQSKIVDAHNKVMDKFSQRQERLAKQAESLENQEKAREERRLRQSKKLIKAKNEELELMRKTAQESIALAKEINEEEERRLKAQERAIQNRIDATKRYNQYDANRGGTSNSNNISAQIDSQILQNRKEANEFSLLLQQSLIEEQEQVKKSNLAWKQYFTQYSRGIKEAEESGKDFAKALKARLEEEEKLAQQQEKTRQQEESARLKEEKSMSGSTNIYDHYSKKQRELTAQLRALEIQYQLSARSGKANTDELKRQRDNIASLEKEYKELTAVLDEVENRTGGSTRSRNQMLVETNQLLREMPNFAISAQTGILSLSNNLPMFFEAWQRTSQEIDDSTNKAKGFKGAMAQFVSSLFSVQTALVVLVTLMVQYGDAIIDFVTSVSDAEKYQRRFNEALKDSLDDKAKDIALLQKLKTVMADANATMAQRNKAIEEAKNAFGGYFDNISSVTSGLDEMNLAIERQILYLQQQAEYEAHMSSIAEYTKDVQLAQTELNKEFGFWENTWNNLRREFIKFPIYDKMSESGRKYIDTMSELHKANVISVNDYRTAWVRVKEYEESQGKLNQALIEGNKGLSEQERNLTSLVAKLKEELDVAQRIHKNNIERYNFTDKKIVNEINNLNLLISKNEELLDKQRQQREEQERVRRDTNIGGITDEEQALMMARTELYKARKDTREYLSANANLIWTQFAVDVRNLQSQFDKLGGYSKDNEKYMIALAELEAKRDASLRDNVLSTKKERKERQSIWDIDKAILNVREKLTEINNDIKSAMLDEASVGFMDIVENESKDLDERLKNLDLYYKNEKEKILFEQEKELAIIEEGEIRKKALEAKLGRTISTEQDLQSLVREKKLNDEQKNFLAMTLTYNKERERITKEANAKLENLEKGRADKTTDTIKSDFDKRVDDYQAGLQAVTEAIRSGTNAQILELNKKRKEVGMTETQYYRELESIIKGEGAKVITAQLDFIEKYKQDLETFSNGEEYDNLSVEAKNSINNMLQFLTNAYADATRRVEKDTSKYKSIGELIRGWFGKNDKGNFNLTQQQVDEMIGGVISSFQSMFDSLNKMWDNYYEKRQQETDKEEERFDKYYNNEKYRIESSLESQEEKERMLKELDGQRLASEQEVDRKRREIARQQAQREKQQAMFQATTKTALGIINIWSQYAAAPIVAGVLTVALMGALAAQMAAIQSAPIPAYEKGTPKQGHKGGMALVGEKRRELVITPDGQMFYTPSSPTLMNLPQGTHVLPNPDAMSNQAKMEAVSRLSKTRRNSGGFDVSLLSNDIKHLTSVVRNKQENYFDLKNGEIRKMVKKNNARINYIGRC